MLRCQLPGRRRWSSAREPVRLTLARRACRRPAGRQHGLRDRGRRTAADFETRDWPPTGVVDGADQVGVAAPGGPLRSREVRFYRVRVQTGDGWTDWSPVLRVEAGLLRAEDWERAGHHAAGRPGRDRQAPAPLLRREFELPAPVARGPPLRHRRSASTRSASTASRSATSCSRRAGRTYRHRLLADTYDVTALLRPGPNVIAARARRRLVSRPPRLGPGRRPLPLRRARWRSSPSSRWSSADGSRLSGRDGRGLARVDRRDPLGRPVRRLPSSTCAQRQAGWDQPGLRRRGLAAGRGRAVRSGRSSSRASRRRSAWSRRCRPRAGAPGPTASLRLDGGQNIAGFVRLRVRGQRRRPGHRPPRRGARARRLAPHAGRCARRRRPTRTSSPTTREIDARAALHVPRLPVRRGRDRRRGPRAPSSWPSAATRRAAARSRARIRASTGSTRTSSGRSATTSCRCPPTARSATSGSAGPATPRRSRRRPARSSTRRRSGRAGCATSRSTRTTSSACPPSCPTSCSTGEPRFGRAGWADAATIVPWAVYESYGDAAGPAPPARQHAPLGRLAARAGRDPMACCGRRHAVRRLARPRRADRPTWEAKADSEYLANAFFAHSARLAADAAALLGRRRPGRPSAARWRIAVAAATWERWARPRHRRRRPAARWPSASASCPTGERPRSRRRSPRSCARPTDGSPPGFLGTPLVLPALADAGHFDEAYLMLLRTRDAVVALPGATRARRRSGSAGTRSGPTARSTRAR